MNGTVNVNNYILTILSFAFSSLFTFISYLLLLVCSPSTFSGTHVRTVRTGSFAPGKES